jgi:hypothetical protein
MGGRPRFAGNFNTSAIAFLSDFVRLFAAEHVRRCWFLGVLAYLTAYFFVFEPDRMQRLAARVRVDLAPVTGAEVQQRLLVGHKVVFQYARSFAASCGFVQCSLEKRCS